MLKLTEEKFLEGKVALITGAGGGFGREMARIFAEKGANLIINDINLEGLEETKAIVEKENKVEILIAQAEKARIAFFYRIQS